MFWKLILKYCDVQSAKSTVLRNVTEHACRIINTDQCWFALLVGCLISRDHKLHVLLENGPCVYYQTKIMKYAVLIFRLLPTNSWNIGIFGRSFPLFSFETHYSPQFKSSDPLQCCCDVVTTDDYKTDLLIMYRDRIHLSGGKRRRNGRSKDQ